jgi:prepilin-type N-terminal cleavage/methylation domain-containing protein
VVKRAFTLIELLVAMGAGVIVSGVIAASLVGGWRAQLSQETYSELQRSARLTLDEITKQVQSASSIVSMLESNGTTYQSGGSTVILRLPPLNADNDIIEGDDYIIFRQTTATIERLIIADANSSRAALAPKLTLNHDAGLLGVKYYNAAGDELIADPNQDNISPSRRLEVTVRSSRLSAGRTFSREIDSMIMLRNKAQ